MILPDLLINDVSDSALIDFSAVAGGSINDCFCLRFDDGQKFFLKRNLVADFPEMFQKEAKGLQILKEAGVSTPTVLKVFQDDSYQYLLLSYHPPKGATSKQWSDAGEMLAKLHKTTHNTFGLNHHNYMGSLLQQNSETESFPEFFVTSRLLPQVKLARDAGYFHASHTRNFDTLFEKIERLIPKEPPALVHGDLWMGNFHSTEVGVMLIDPAVSFSHREADIAMTRLFGSPPSDFYHSYQQEYPLEQEFEERYALFNLYPLLIHLNLFGEPYLLQVEQSLHYYVR